MPYIHKAFTKDVWLTPRDIGTRELFALIIARFVYLREFARKLIHAKIKTNKVFK